MKLFNFVRVLGIVIIMLCSNSTIYSQCETFKDNPNKAELEDYYVVYREFLKNDKYEEAFKYWEKVHEKAPAVDGKRNRIFTDGIFLYIDKFKKKRDENEKQEIVNKIYALIEQNKICYPEIEIEPLPKEVLKYKNN